mmetsp:Transcript_84969/g.216451  ORF Transcript_84969/g.216451 Transcript_84969/m.216451 type:complete len:253 (-) Transcript_84969:910-1668(-)
MVFVLNLSLRTIPDDLVLDPLDQCQCSCGGLVGLGILSQVAPVRRHRGLAFVQGKTVVLALLHEAGHALHHGHCTWTKVIRIQDLRDVVELRFSKFGNIRVVELHQPVRRQVEDLHGFLVRGHQQDEIRVVRLAILCGTRHCKVHVLDGLSQRQDLRHKGLQRLTILLDLLLLPGDLDVDLLDVLVGPLHLRAAMVDLVRLDCLLLAAQANHVLDHAEDLVEASFARALPAQGQGQQVQLRSVTALCRSCRT